MDRIPLPHGRGENLMLLLLCGIPKHGLPQHRRRFLLMKHNHLPLNLYRTPFTPAYWREARVAMSSLKLLVFAALMVAVTRALSLVPGIPIAHTKLTWGLPSPRSLCALVCGPVMGLVFGFVEDILGFILHPTGDFFQGTSVHYGRSAGLCPVLFPPPDHGGPSGGCQPIGQPAG